MRKLILCCDGTWNRADQERNGVACPTNVVRLAYRIAKADGPAPQLIYYDQGVGTGNLIDRLSGGAFGEGLEDNVHDAFRFLIANYELGDQIYLFGFSRGAFTARSIGGMIRKCGILKRASIAKYRSALELYRSESPPDGPTAAAFRREHSIAGDGEIPIQMIGVWDTVGSLGIPLRGLRWLTRQRYQFHDTELSGTVKFAFHALAVDERRGPFVPTLWMNKPKPGQEIVQTWFCGAHSDVGGGYAESGLSDIALEWMLENAARAGLKIEPPFESAHPPKPDPRGMLHNSKTRWYALTPGVSRPIGFAAVHPEQAGEAPLAADPTQSVHPSVLTRWDQDPEYRPRNLREYFTRAGDPRGTSA